MVSYLKNRSTENQIESQTNPHQEKERERKNLSQEKNQNLMNSKVSFKKYQSGVQIKLRRPW